MQANQLPAKIQVPFASGGNASKNNIPVASQIGITPGAASFTDGFPPLTMQPLAAGGVPPSGKDFNGILNAITAVLQWECAGGFFPFDGAFAAANNGYPKGAILQSAGTNDLWLNQVDGNTTNPDATDGSAANWVSLAAYGIGAVTGLTNANVTLTPAQYSKRIITLAGALTGNVQITVPNAQRDYAFINNTTGAYSVTVKTAAGTGVQIPQGQMQSVYCDGTNINALHAPAVGNAAQAFLVGLATLSSHAAQLGQVPVQTSQMSNFSAGGSSQSISGAVNTLIVPTAVSFDDTGEYTLASGKFTAQRAGIYVFAGNVHGTSSSPMGRVLMLYKNGVEVYRLQENNSTPPAAAIAGSSIPIKLNAGDYVQLYYFSSSADTLNGCSFGGWRIK